MPNKRNIRRKKFRARMRIEKAHKQRNIEIKWCIKRSDSDLRPDPDSDSDFNYSNIDKEVLDVWTGCKLGDVWDCWELRRIFILSFNNTTTTQKEDIYLDRIYYHQNNAFGYDRFELKYWRQALNILMNWLVEANRANPKHIIQKPPMPLPQNYQYSKIDEKYLSQFEFKPTTISRDAKTGVRFLQWRDHYAVIYIAINMACFIEHENLLHVLASKFASAIDLQQNEKKPNKILFYF